MIQKTTAVDKRVRPKSIGVPLTKADSEKLSELARRGRRSRQLEAMLRLHDHLRRVPEIIGDYYEIKTL
ncbi:TraY domain-containing protein [Enterobacter asburiae]